MGIIHDVVQLKPQIVYGNAFIKVKPNCELDFKKCYQNSIENYSKISVIPHNTRLDTSDASLKVSGSNLIEYEIENIPRGLFLCIQGGTKHGFEKVFKDLLAKWSEFLENALFCVQWDNQLEAYEIKSGILNIQSFVIDHDNPEVHYERLLGSNKSLLKDFYLSQGYKLKRLYEFILEEYGQVRDWIDSEAYLNALFYVRKAEQIENNEETQNLIKWLLKKTVRI